MTTKIQNQLPRGVDLQRLVLLPVCDTMKFADRLQITTDDEGRRSFYFKDRTGFVHASFRENDWLSSVPENVVSAAQMPDRKWYWIISEQNSEIKRT